MARRGRADAGGRARGRDPSNAPDIRCAAPLTPCCPCAAARSRLSSSTPDAERSSFAATTVAAAARAVRTPSTPPGSASTSTASPPAAGNRHNDAGGLSSSSVGRAATNRRSPSAVKVGDDSPFAPRVRRRAGCLPAGSSSHIALTNSVRFSLSSAIDVTTRDPSGDTARPDTAWEGQELVEVVERCRHHAHLVAHRASRFSRVSLTFKLAAVMLA